MSNKKKNPTLEAIYGAIWEWNEFTIPDVVRSSQVSRAKVMKVLDGLQEEGMIEEEDLGSCKLYRLTRNPEKRDAFLQKYQDQKSPRKPEPDSARTKRFIEETRVLLDDVDQKFNEITAGAGDELLALKKGITSKLDISEDSLCSAIHFACGEDKKYKLPENHPIRPLKARFDKAVGRAKEAGVDFPSGFVDYLFGKHFN